MSSWCLFLPSAHITVLFFYVSSLRVSAGLHLRWSIGWARRSTTLNLFATGHTRWVLIHIRPGVFLGADCVWSCCWTVRLYSHHIRHCSHNASAPIHLGWGSVFRLRRWGLQGMLEIKRSGPAAKKLNHHQHCGGQSPSTPNLDNLCYNGLGWLLRCCRQGVSSWEMCPCPHNVYHSPHWPGNYARERWGEERGCNCIQLPHVTFTCKKTLNVIILNFPVLLVHGWCRGPNSHLCFFQTLLL